MAGAFESIASSSIHWLGMRLLLWLIWADMVHRYVMGLDRYLIDGCMVVTLQTSMDIARVQAYAQGVEDRHRGRQPDRDYNRGQHKRSRSAGYPDEFRSGQSQQHVRFSSEPAQSAPPRSWVGGSIVWNIRNLVRALGRQGHRWAGV